MNLFKKKSKENVIQKVVAAGALIAMVVVNALSATLPINGKTPGEISDSYANLFAPAGVTFSIWSLIYLLLTGYIIYQFLSVRKKHTTIKEETLSAITPLFIGTSLINIAWIFSWHYEVLWLSVILMVALLYLLIKINLILHNKSFSTLDTLLIKAPFSVYFGWITVATVANITTWLVSINWDGFGLRQGVWMVAILIVATIIALATIIRMRDWIYGAVIVWAFAGILLKHLSPGGWNGMYPSVLATLYIVLPIIIITSLSIALQKNNPIK
jgi:hypothetical protein